MINWIRPCENHFFWSTTSTLSGNGSVIYAKFKSFLSHVINKHDNLDDPLYNKCNHGEIKHRTWLDKGMFKLMQWVLELSVMRNHVGKGENCPPMSSFSHYYWLICQILDSFYTLWISGLEESIVIMGIHADVIYIFAHCIRLCIRKATC